jgi:hypothetical protein
MIQRSVLNPYYRERKTFSSEERKRQKLINSNQIAFILPILQYRLVVKNERVFLHSVISLRVSP